MRVLNIGVTGNLGSRVVPALLAHGHSVVAYVRTPEKLQEVMSASVLEKITVHEGDGTDASTIAMALRQFQCDAIINTAGTRESPWRQQTMGRLVIAITEAALTVGNERGRPLRAWFIGGLGSLAYPGTKYQIQDYMPGFMTAHHRQTEDILKGTEPSDLAWSLLCVAMMYPDSEEPRQLLTSPRHHGLVISKGVPPNWPKHWSRWIPLVGNYTSLLPAISSYRTQYEEVADFIAEDLACDAGSQYVGYLVGFKPGASQPKEVN